MIAGRRLVIAPAALLRPTSGLLARRRTTPLTASMGSSSGKPGADAAKTFYDFGARDITGEREMSFAEFREKVVIVVNAATYCSLTKANYTGLSALLDAYYERGLRVLLFPCNQFMSQERDAPSAIKAFAEGYDKRFVIAERSDVNGSEAHPLWKWLKGAMPGFLTDSVKWNFTKFLIDRTGKPIARFAPTDEPATMKAKIEEALSQ